MSQRRRSSSSQTPSEPTRMPFEAAQALLWGRETHREHQFLFPRMKELEEQHQSYDARIQATEAVAEAAEAATSRIRRIEQQVAAIESDEQDRPFDKWVEGEITGFKGFMEQNKTVRQKHIELETKISDLEDGVDKAKDASRDVEILLNRIGRLENERVHDANRIKRLEKELLNLTSMRSKQAKETNDLQTVMARPTLPQRVVPPVPIRENSSNQSKELNDRTTAMAHMASSKYVGRPLPAREHPEASEAGDETEDEENLPAHRTYQPEGEQIQVPQSPIFNSKSTSTVLPSSPIKGRGNMSARLRVMQRKSFFEPKQSREDEQQRPVVPGHASKSRSHLRPASPPPTQIINRGGADRSVSTIEPQTPEQVPTKQLIVKLSVRKRKVEEAVPSTRLTRSQAKKNDDSRSKVTVDTRLEEPAAKRRKPNATRAPPQARSKAKQGSNAADLVKMSLRKVAMPTKRDSPVSNLVPPPTQLLASPRKKQTAKSNVTSGSAKSRGHPGASSKDAEPSKSKTVRQGKLSNPPGTAAQRNSKLAAPNEGVTATLSKTKPAASRPEPKAQRGLQRPPLAMPVTFDSVTYEEMKRKGEFIF